LEDAAVWIAGRAGKIVAAVADPARLSKVNTGARTVAHTLQRVLLVEEKIMVVVVHIGIVTADLAVRIAMPFVSRISGYAVKTAVAAAIPEIVAALPFLALSDARLKTDIRHMTPDERRHLVAGLMASEPQFWRYIDGWPVEHAGVVLTGGPGDLPAPIAVTLPDGARALDVASYLAALTLALQEHDRRLAALDA
jgi:hypothetical protein